MRMPARRIPFRHECLRPRTRAVVPWQGGSTPAADLKPGKGSVPYKVEQWTIRAFVVVERTVLHDVSYDPKLVKVAAPAFGPERLLEGDLLSRSERRWRTAGMRANSDGRGEEVRAHLHVVDVISIPRGAEELVAEAENQDVLDHLLPQVMVDPEDLLLLPVRVQRLLQFSRAL